MGCRAICIARCHDLVRFMYPFITLVSVTALVMGMLNSKRVFFIPAVASAFFNLGCIIGGVAMAWVLDPGFREGQITEKGLTGFAIGTLIGGVMQLAIQIPSLKKVGFRFGLDFGWKDKGVSEVLHLMWPSLIAAGGTQIGARRAREPSRQRRGRRPHQAPCKDKSSSSAGRDTGGHRGLPPARR